MRLPAMQRIERSGDGRDLAADEPLRLRAHLLEPGAEVAVLGVLHGEAVAHLAVARLGEPVVDAQRARLAREELGEVRLAEPRRRAGR